MNKIREIVATNLVTLRKRNNLTQVELAKKINFSDKAISRWEKGEVLPDLETLQNIAKIYGVNLSYIIEEHDIDENGLSKPTRNELLLHASSICVIWVFFTMAFVYLKLFHDYIFWQAFVWGVPITAFYTLRFLKKWNSGKAKLWMRSLATWSLLASIYLQFLYLNLWLIFVVGIPVQLAIVIAYFTKPKLDEKLD